MRNEKACAIRPGRDKNSGAGRFYPNKEASQAAAQKEAPRIYSRLLRILYWLYDRGSSQGHQGFGDRFRNAGAAARYKDLTAACFVDIFD